MPYATKQAMIDRFGERELVDLTDRAEPYTGAIVDAVLDRAMTSADAEVDAALRGRYAVPVDPAPELLVDLACDLARWRLWDNDIPEAVAERAKAARASLGKIARHELVLDVPAAVSATTGSGDVRYEAAEPAFTRDTMDGF